MAKKSIRLKKKRNKREVVKAVKKVQRTGLFATVLCVDEDENGELETYETVFSPEHVGLKHFALNFYEAHKLGVFHISFFPKWIFDVIDFGFVFLGENYQKLIKVFRDPRKQKLSKHGLYGLSARSIEQAFMETGWVYDQDVRNTAQKMLKMGLLLKTKLGTYWYKEDFIEYCSKEGIPWAQLSYPVDKRSRK